jgi:lysophospholipase L1-like esterase
VEGDSVALTLAQGLPRGEEHGVALVNEADLGCGLVRGGPYRYFGAEYEALPQCQDWPGVWSEHVAQHDPDVVFVLVGRWEVMDRVVDGRWTQIGDPVYDTHLLEEFEQLIPALTGRGARIALATAPYYKRGERPDGGMWPEDDPARVDRYNELVRTFAARHPEHVGVVELGAQMSEGAGYTSTVAGVRLRYDGVHVTTQGSRWLAPWLLPQLRALGEAAAQPVTPP